MVSTSLRCHTARHRMPQQDGQYGRLCSGVDVRDGLSADPASLRRIRCCSGCAPSNRVGVGLSTAYSLKTFNEWTAGEKTEDIGTSTSDIRVGPSVIDDSASKDMRARRTRSICNNALSDRSADKHDGMLQRPSTSSASTRAITRSLYTSSVQLAARSRTKSVYREVADIIVVVVVAVSHACICFARESPPKHISVRSPSIEISVICV